ncbi:hypothetical protein C2S52_020679 [Perilla frutescens var. hirtella]|nr:hypothetical protein C2S52_020679 [Perilla frutescens var. hirtella]KAH6805190.1 hypothetical protein C2S51_030021 [Perilla frutescens var. frutescens]
MLQEESNPSLSVSKQLRDVTVRIVHAGGRIEMFETAVPAAKLIRRYPGMCIARPDVFRHPHEAVLSADDVLLPGNKYFVVRCTTVEKLKKRLSRKGRNNEGAGGGDGAALEGGDDIDRSSEESVCDEDFVVPKNGWSILRKHMREKKKFVPPIQRPRIWKDSDWEPSLTSIKELSP